MGHKKGFLIPLLTWIFKLLYYIAPLTIAIYIGKLFHKSWGKSYLIVEIYVIAWFAVLLSFVCLVSKDKICLLIVLVLIIWRLSDISQSWFNIFIKARPQVLSPVRSLLLTTINYFELAVIFGLLAFLFKNDFYPSFETITQSLRYSIGVITTTGSLFDPATIVGGLIYYTEIAFGLAFLVVIISRILSLFREPNNN